MHRPTETRGLLYFPYMNAPDGDWFTRVLLYWDVVGLIIPRAPTYSLSQYTQELMRERLIDVVRPEPEQVRAVAEGFSGLLPYATPSNAVSPMALHISKLESPMAYEMERRGLASQDDTGSWYLVDAPTAQLYMAYLAIVLGNELGLTAMTNTSDPLDAISMLPRSETLDRRAAQLQQGLLDGLMPAPADRISARDLRAFKEDHADSLQRLRLRLESAVYSLICEDPKLQERRLQVVQRDLEGELAAVKEAMTRRKWSVLGGTLAGVGMAPAAASLGVSVAAGDVVGVGINAAMFVGALVGALGTLRTSREWQQAPLAYAAMARSTFPVETA